MMINLYKLKTYPIEQIIDQINIDSLNKGDLLNKLKLENLPPKDEKVLKQKLDFAFNRINEPLELSLKIFYLFVPFGILNLFSKSDDSNFKRFKKYRYTKKIRHYYIFSTIGFLTYSIVAIIAGLYSRYYH